MDTVQKYQTFLSLHQQENNQITTPCLTINTESNVASFQKHGKSFKQKYDSSITAYTNQEFYTLIFPAIQEAFENGGDLAILSQGFSGPGKSVVFGDLASPGDGIANLFIDNIPSLIKPNDIVKMSYMNIYKGNLCDYFKKGDKPDEQYSQVKFGLIEAERTFTNVTEVQFTSAEELNTKINSVLPMRNNKHTSMLVSRECIPLLRFEISRNETSFSIEFFYVPNTMKILHG